MINENSFNFPTNCGLGGINTANAVFANQSNLS